MEGLDALALGWRRVLAPLLRENLDSNLDVTLLIFVIFSGF